MLKFLGRGIMNETYSVWRNSCENENWNLECIRIVGDDINKFVIPERYKDKYGIWLIGFDGGDKSYSTDVLLLKEINIITDTMPIRQSDIAEKIKKCNQGVWVNHSPAIFTATEESLAGLLWEYGFRKGRKVFRGLKLEWLLWRAILGSHFFTKR